MQLQTAETTIPEYKLEPDLVTGNTVFRISWNEGVQKAMRKEFLLPHRKGYYFFAFIKTGNSRHWIDMTPYELKPNTFYFTVPSQVHLKEQTVHMTGMIMSFTEEFLAINENQSLRKLPLIQNPGNGHELNLNERDLAFVEDVLHKIYAEYTVKNEWHQSMLLAYVKVLLIYLSRLYTEQISEKESAPGRQLLKKYLSKIEEGYAHHHEVAAYADMLHLSAGHLSEVVKEQSGKPAIVHIHERLVLEAKRLLFHSELSIKEIAFQLGFEDDSYFNKFFKRLTQATPSQYRTTIRKMYH